MRAYLIGCWALLAVGCGDQEATNPLQPPSDADTDEGFRPLPDASNGVTSPDATSDDSLNVDDVIQSDTSSDAQAPEDAPTDAASPSDVTSNDAPSDADIIDTPLPPGPLIKGLTLSRVDLYQTVQLSWMMDRQSSPSTLPLIAGRATLVRAFVSTQPSWRPQEVTARVLVQSARGARAFVATAMVTSSSTEDATSSTLNVRLPPEVVTTDAQVSVMLIASPSGDGELAPPNTQHLAAWPAIDQLSPLGARDDSGPLKVTLVPIRYDTDGSGRLPDTSATQLARYEAVLRALYPATDVQLTVHAAIPWGSSLRFGSLNQALVQLKEDDRAPADTFYYGLIQPADTFDAYCGWSCTTGQSYTVSDASSGSYHVGSGMGFGSEDSAWTLAHELGHMHGRGHAPCGVSAWSSDGSYPHSSGGVGVWGWDMRADTFKAPSDWTDLMGYCDNLWLSDYTYQGIYDRAAAVRASFGQLSPFPSPQTYRFLTLSPQYPPSWGATATLTKAHTGRWLIARALDPSGLVLRERAVPAIATGHAGDLDVLIPQDLIAPPCAALNIDGAHIPLSP
jgi:hypothetical protein